MKERVLGRKIGFTCKISDVLVAEECGEEICLNLSAGHATFLLKKALAPSFRKSLCSKDPERDQSKP